MYGHQGKLLKVNLSDGHIEEENFSADYAEKFLGGNGFAAKMIWDSVPADADPLGPENAVVFTAGPLTDTLIWGSSRGHMASLSPLTSGAPLLSGEKARRRRSMVCKLKQGMALCAGP